MAEKCLLPLPPALVIILWLAGLWHLEISSVTCYVSYSAIAATAVVGIVLVALVVTAASQIARRSLW